MSGGGAYDTTTFHALQDELKALNESAIADGLVAPRDGRIAMPKRPVRQRARRATPRQGASTPQTTAASVPAKRRKGGPDRGKAAAKRLLALLVRGADDKSPAVPGTRFTEAGVARLLARLRRKRSGRIGAWLRFLQRVERYLSLPVSSGVHTIDGVGLERLQVFSRQLDDIARIGWAQFQEIRTVKRRGRLARAGNLPLPEDGTAPAATRRKKGSSR